MQSLNGVYVNGDRIITELPWALSAGDTIQLDIPTDDADPEYLFDLVEEKITTVEAKGVLAEHRADIDRRKQRQKGNKGAVLKRHCIACVTRTNSYPHCPVHCAKGIKKDNIDGGGSSSSSTSTKPNEQACLCKKNTALRTKDENTQGAGVPPPKRFKADGGGVRVGVMSKEQMEKQKRLEEEARVREEEKEKLKKELEESSRRAVEQAAEAQRQLKELQQQLQEQEVCVIDYEPN